MTAATTPAKFDYIALDFELSTEADEWQQEDAEEVAAQIIAEAPGAKFLYIEAGRIDWRGNSGAAIKEIDAATFWQDIAGTRGDWTLRAPGKIKGGAPIEATVSSHDVPTGGGRLVKLLDGAGMYKQLLARGNSRQDIINGVAGYTFDAEARRATNAQIIEALEYAGAEEVEGIFL